MGPCDGIVGHCDGAVGHCDGTVGHCDGTVGHCDGTVGHCDGTVGHCDGTVGLCDRTVGHCDVHFYCINLANPQAWEIFPGYEVFFNFFLQRLEFFVMQIFHLLVRVTPRYYMLFVTLVMGVVSVISFQTHLFFEYSKSTDLFELILHPAIF